MKITDISINRSVTFTMIFLAIAAFGLVSLSRLSPELFPDVTFPVASIVVTYEGVGAEDMEQLIARPIEGVVSTITNVKEVNTTCKEGAIVIFIQFNWGTNMDEAANDIRSRIDLIRQYLPSDSTDPLIFKFDVSLQPILFVGISSDTLDPATLRKLSEDSIEPELERIEGVAAASTIGGESRQIQVQLDREKLESHNLSIQQVINVLRGENLTLPGGEIDEDKITKLVRTVGEFTSINQIENVVVSYQSNAPIYVKDIGQVVDTYADKKQISNVMGKPSVLLSIQKQADSNTVRVAARARKALKDIEDRLAGQAKMEIIGDASTFIEDSLSGLYNAGLQGAILAVLVLFFFLHNLRSVLIIALAIPMSVIATFTAMDFGDITLNILSMGGLILGVGLLVDNSIVVLENIFRHRTLGENRRTAASNGASEVAIAIIASTLTTISVFLPVIFVPGIAGILFRDQALTVTFSLTASLFVALTLIPLLSSRFLALESERKTIGWIHTLSCKVGFCMEKLDDIYQKALNWALDHRKLMVLSVFGIFLLSLSIVWPLRLIGTEFSPPFDEGEIALNIATPPGTKLEVTSAAVEKAEQIIREVAGDDLQVIYSSIGSGEGFAALFGSSGPNTASITIELKNIRERKRSQEEIERAIKDRLTEIAGAELEGTVNFAAEIFGFGGTPISIEIYGFDREVATQLANRIKRMVEGVEGTADVQISLSDRSPELQVAIDRDRAYSLGLNVANIASTVQGSVFGTVATRFREGGDEYDVLVRLKEEDRRTRDDIYNVAMMSPMMTKVPLRNVATIKPAEGSVTIDRKDQDRIVTVSANLRGRDLGSVTRDVKAGLNTIETPEGFIIAIGGSAQEQTESFRWLALAFVGAVFLVYAVMASLYESFLTPFVIMFTLPLAIIGVIWMFFLTGTIFSIIAFVGVIMLAGIVVNNGIVMIDYINQLRAKGMELREAVVTGGRTRLRPVLMTTLTTVFAMIPLALGIGAGSEIRYPLARAVVGGLSVSMLLTLVFLPVMYVIFTNRIIRRKERKALKSQQRGIA